MYRDALAVAPPANVDGITDDLADRLGRPYVAPVLIRCRHAFLCEPRGDACGRLAGYAAGEYLRYVLAANLGRDKRTVVLRPGADVPEWVTAHQRAIGAAPIVSKLHLLTDVP